MTDAEMQQSPPSNSQSGVLKMSSQMPSPVYFSSQSVQKTISRY